MDFGHLGLILESVTLWSFLWAMNLGVFYALFQFSGKCQVCDNFIHQLLLCSASQFIFTWSLLQLWDHWAFAVTLIIMLFYPTSCPPLCPVAVNHASDNVLYLAEFALLYCIQTGVGKLGLGKLGLGKFGFGKVGRWGGKLGRCTTSKSAWVEVDILIMFQL